jgi:hypothetical protein
VVVLSTPENQQAVDGDNQRDRDRWSTYVRFTGLLWKEPGYKVAWIERVCHYVKLLPRHWSLGFRASTTRVELASHL